jgi:hypothetical protein
MIMSSFRCSGLPRSSPSVDGIKGEREVHALPLNSLRQFSCHPWVHLNSGDIFGFFKDFDGKVTCTRTDFEDFIRGAKVRLHVMISIYEIDPAYKAEPNLIHDTDVGSARVELYGNCKRTFEQSADSSRYVVRIFLY